MTSQESSAIDIAEENTQSELQSDQRSLVSDSIVKALNIARDKLIDRSLRNKLINAKLNSTKSRQIRIVDEKPDQVFDHLRSKKYFIFIPGKGLESANTSEEEVLFPTSELDPNRHTDNKLQTQLTPEGLQKKLLSLCYESETLEEEQGVNVLFLALGFLEWRETEKSDSLYAPLVLLPVELSRDRSKDRFKLLLRDEDLITNISLQAWLKDQYGIALPDIPETDDWNPSLYFEKVCEVIEVKKGWSVQTDEMLLGFFSFAKFLLWRDLNPENWPNKANLLENPILKKLLIRNDEEANELDTPILGDAERIDDVWSPMQLVHITDADSSQAIAIQEVLEGKSLVIQGPPGTGKSQTITNIIAGAVNQGKRVLFVAEKMAALEVVHDRLAKKKLAPICLELHSRKSSKSQVIEQIKQSQKAPAPPRWSERAFNELEDTQRRLRDYSDRLHHSESDSFSQFRLMGEINLLKVRGTPTPDFFLPLAAKWSGDELIIIQKEIQKIADRLFRIGIPVNHPWRGVNIRSLDVLTRDRIRPIVVAYLEQVDKLVVSIGKITELLAIDKELTINEIQAWIDGLYLLSERPASYDSVIIKNEIIDYIELMLSLSERGSQYRILRDKASKAFRTEAFSENWISTRRHLAAYGQSILRIFYSDYRKAIAGLKGVWKGDFPKHHRRRLSYLDALIDMQEVENEILQTDQNFICLLENFWRGINTDWDSFNTLAGWLSKAKALDPQLSILNSTRLIDPNLAKSLSHQLSEDIGATITALNAVQQELQLDFTTAFLVDDPKNCRVNLLQEKANSWMNSFDQIVDWTAARDGLAYLSSIQANDLAERVYDGRLTASLLEPVFMLSAYEAIWKEKRAKNPGLDKIFGDELDNLVSRFRKADTDRINIASDQVARAHLDRHPGGTAGAAGVLEEEMRKSRNLMPVRKLMLKAGDAIQRFNPVFLMSPLSIAQYLEPGALTFDILVIDEASQVRPEDALGAIARCKQLVVVGDDRQLPPTNFFSRIINDDTSNEDEENIESNVQHASVKDFESILNLCSRFPSRMLKWHYRSEHPALIAISNHNFYKGELMLPPSVITGVTDGETGLVFKEVPRGGYERGKTARNEVEAKLIAEATLHHAKLFPHLSLGIGTFSVSQRDCIRDCIDNLARENPELDELLKPRHGSEPLFVKNLENIQGDERDVIFISVGYGHDANGKLTQNFGPVGREGGERRLNVLITRARKRCEVFSSIIAEDIKFDGTGKPGVQALKEFLKLAKDGYSDIPIWSNRGFDSPFEEAVAYEVGNLGYDVKPQVGMAGFFIDLAVIDPRDPGRYLLGIECDGAAYHSSRYARDRDRLRQSILESRGWKIYRIWSTDWFYKPEREIERLKEAIDRALDNTAAVLQDACSDLEEPGNETELIESGTSTNYRDTDNLNDKKLPDYQFADFKIRPLPILPQELSKNELANWTAKIVQVEQPIHSEEVGRRLANCCGKQKAGSQIQEATLKGLYLAKRRGVVTEQNSFWYFCAGESPRPRDRSNLERSASVRKPDFIAPSEYEEAGIHALQLNISLDRDELINQIARLLGFDRIGPDVRAAVEKVVDNNLTLKTKKDHLGRYCLSQTLG